MGTLEGMFLVPTPKNDDTGLWFIFHHEGEGILAFDVTQMHPDIPAKHFAPLLPDASLDRASVLLGGPKQSDSALLILHTNPAAGTDSHVAGEFAFHSYRFRLIPGEPPSLTRADDGEPEHLKLRGNEPFAIIVGFDLWEMDTLEAQLKDWQWTFLPATSEIVFDTPPAMRLEKARRMIN